jgi:hypothetical protein
MMERYYQLIQDLRKKLVAGGEDSWAQDLLSAERSSATFGEALHNLGLVLGELQNAHATKRLGLEDDLRTILVYGQEIWNQSNR